MPLSPKFAACLATALVVLPLQAVRANSYSIDDLGVGVTPFGIARSGVAAGVRGDQAVMFRNGRWRALPFADRAGVAAALNDHGDIVGAQGTTPILWHRFGRRQVLALPGGASSGSAAGVAGDGTAVGRFISSEDPFHAHCFRTLPDGTAIDLGLFAQGGGCAATGINARGEIVGAADVFSSGPPHAFLWRAGILHDLGTLGGDTSEATAINGHGQVVGRSDLLIDGPDHAFSWKQGVMQDIGSSPDFPATAANAINAQGEIVGAGMRRDDGSLRALRFAGGAVIALEDEVQDLGDWLLVSANAIDDDGVIVGQAMRQGDGLPHGFLLRPLVGQPAPNLASSGSR
jgi:probable HAF family extracellular repeat protein